MKLQRHINCTKIFQPIFIRFYFIRRSPLILSFKTRRWPKKNRRHQRILVSLHRRRHQKASSSKSLIFEKPLKLGIEKKLEVVVQTKKADLTNLFIIRKITNRRKPDLNPTFLDLIRAGTSLGSDSKARALK